MTRLVLLRHGQSLWNQEGRFTGWMDIDLSPKGVKEAYAAGRTMSCAGITIDLAYTSLLKRAIRTLGIVLEQMNLTRIPTIKSWRLNERAYGPLEGKSIGEVEELYGPETVYHWRKGFSSRPPCRVRRVATRAEGRLHIDSDAGQMPASESLKDVQERLMPLWHSQVAVDLRERRNVIIVSHGNTIRALIKHLEGMSDQAIEKVTVPTATPIVYELDRRLRPIECINLCSSDESIEDKL